VIQSLEQNNLVLVDLVRDFWKSGVMFDWRNYQTLLAMFVLILFTTISFGIEKLASLGAPEFLVSE
jgi:hypothetical protein